MPGVDWVPIISQIKSILQGMVCSNGEGTTTLKNFVQECPLFSQITSIVLVNAGKFDLAVETQMKCANTLGNIINWIPIIGHIKGFLYRQLGEEINGNRALLSATRTGFVLFRPMIIRSPFVAAICTGIIFDTLVYLISQQSHSVLHAYMVFLEEPCIGNAFDIVIMHMFDGFCGMIFFEERSKPYNSVSSTSYSSNRYKFPEIDYFYYGRSKTKINKSKKNRPKSMKTTSSNTKKNKNSTNKTPKSYVREYDDYEYNDLWDYNYGEYHDDYDYDEYDYNDYY